MTFTKLSDHLYLGDIFDAQRLREEHPQRRTDMIVDARPLVHFSACVDEDWLDVPEMLRAAEAAADYIRQTGNDVYVHCFAGMERSPFLAALILWRGGGCSISEAYDYVKRMHPQTMQYQQWVDKVMEATGDRVS